MGTLLILALLCLPAACLVGVCIVRRLGYDWVRAEFNIGRSRFCIEAEDTSAQPRRRRCDTPEHKNAARLTAINKASHRDGEFSADDPDRGSPSPRS